MELLEAMRTTGTCREFDDRPVPADVLWTAFEAARFGPQGGNRQSVRWVVVTDSAIKQQLADLYLPLWKRYYDAVSGGGIQVGTVPKGVEDTNRFAENLASHPALVVVCAELSGLHVTDADLDRTSVVGGASIYPLVQNLCLALRDLGVASAVTTLLCELEAEVTEILDIPEGFLTAAHLAIGYPAHGFPRKLTRRSPTELVYADRFGAPLFDR